jgi:nucleoside-diphosphate-sugar epimerase
MNVAASLSGKHIVVTGFTGFLAKVYVALLLEYVPDIGRITLLVRPRSARKRALDRVEQAFDMSPVFRRLRAAHGTNLGSWLGERVDAIDADIEKPLCGLDAAALERLATVDLVVHSAGLTDFQPDPLRALSVNVAGAMHAADLARALNVPHVHVSTCYVAGAVSSEIPESLIIGRSPNGTPFDAAAEVRALQLACRRGDAKESATKRIDIGLERAQRLGWTNIYTYTKGLAEHLIGLDEQATIVRPSIVECANTFPFPGWNEGLNTAGPLAWLISTAFRELPTKTDHRFDIIPVDDVARGLATISAAALEGTAGGVFHLASSDVNPLRFGRTVELTGLAMRRWTRKGNGTGLDRTLLRYLDPVPVEKPGFLSVDRLKQWADDATDYLQTKPQRSGWLQSLAGDALDRARSRTSDQLRDTSKQLGRIEGMLELYKPFIEEHDYVFLTDRIRALQSPGPFEADVKGLDWRHYWVDVEYPGLRTWCLPVMHGEKPPRDAASVPPLRFVQGEALRAASK